jgi:Dyp-type peroxidase family
LSQFFLGFFGPFFSENSEFLLAVFAVWLREKLASDLARVATFPMKDRGLKFVAENEMLPQQSLALDLTRSDVDPNNPVFQPMLKDVQANILKGHGRAFAYHIFLELRPAQIADAKAWIANFATNRITSAWKLEQGRRLFKRTGADGGAVFTVSISATGYAALGFGPTQLPVELETPANQIVKDLAAFPDGAKASASKLGDGDVSVDWEPAFRSNVDVLILVADDHPDKAALLADRIIQEVSDFSEVLLNQKGHVLYRQAAHAGHIGIEQFGYADGISQPLYFKDEIEAQASNENWSDREPLNLVLVPDSHGQDFNSFGSFLVFRKLEQNVAGFMNAEEHSVPPIKDSDGIVNKDMAGAMIVGRFRNGNPLVTSGGATGDIRYDSQITNDFNYGNDSPPPPSSRTQYGSKCPFFAHTRITNPRADIKVVPPTFVHSVRLTRRAIPYQDASRFGKGKEDLLIVTDEQLNENRPETGVGLLFMSYQAHIGKQFEFIQNNWANHGHIAGRNIGQDGVIGQKSKLPPGLPFRPADPDLQPRRLPGQWGETVDPSAHEISFGGFIKSKGAEYFFTPSISFLRLLALN